MAAGLGFKDFVTGEVLTAADVDGYLMQNIWVFADSTARDAAVTSPQEGNFAFLKDTNVTTFYDGAAWTNLDTTGMVNPMTTTGDVIYSSSGSTPARLGIGTAGQVLQVNSGATAPEWAAPAAGGGLTLLSTTTLSGASTTISSISQSHKNLLIIGNGIYGNINADYGYRLNGVTSSSYSDSYIRYTGSFAGGTSAATLAGIGAIGTSTDYDKQAYVEINIYRYAETEYKTIFQRAKAKSSVDVHTLRHTAFDSTTAITEITFIHDSGTFSGGTIYIYGVN